MDRALSADEIPYRFRPPSPPPPEAAASPPPPPQAEGFSIMKRSESEWAFERFLQEVVVDSDPSSCSSGKTDVVEIKVHNKNGSSYAAPLAVDSDEYHAFLRSKLNLACAAVTLSCAPFMKRQDPGRADSVSHLTDNSKMVSHAPPSKGPEYDMSRTHDKDSSVTQKKSGILMISTASGSSMEQSEDDENEGETEIAENKDPASAKRVRRMLSNRESARRSRRRKQAHMTELETQVAQMRVENSALLKRLSGITQKYNEAAVDNRVLKADVETLRAKVKMTEEAVKRITGLNLVFQTMPEISTISIPPFDRSPSGTSADAAVPVQDDQKHPYYQPPSNCTPRGDLRTKNGVVADISSVEEMQPNSGAAGLSGNKRGQAPSLHRVASLEHLQKRIRGGVSP